MTFMNVVVLILIITLQNRNFVTAEEETLTCVNRSKVERTFILLKPDALKRRLFGESIKRIEEGCNKCEVVGIKFVWPNITQIHTHYADQKDQLWFQDMVDFMISAPVIPMVWEGENMVAIGRKHILEIRNDYPRSTAVVGHLLNLIHGSDTVDDAQREIRIWFTQDEINDMDNHSSTASKFWHDEEKCSKPQTTN